MTTSSVRACCKINLGLYILGRRADGYHEIASVLFPVPWCDELRFTQVDAVAGGSVQHQFTCSDPLLPTDGRNLCVRARVAFESKFGAVAPLHIHLDKRVPYGAGLGSGSSDAAAVLRYLAEGAGISPADDSVMQVAASIGSDVPFFLLDGPAFATGRGEILEPLGDPRAKLPAGPDAGPDAGPKALALSGTLVIAVPDVQISSGDAYAGVAAAGSYSAEAPDLIHLVGDGDPSDWNGSLRNDFEPFVYATFPQIARLKARMEGAASGAGAAYVSLSGSGSAVYGIFESPGAAEVAAERARELGCTVWIGEGP